jgi:hypothetical protein
VVVGGGSGAVKGVGVGVWVVVGSLRPGGAVGRQALVVAHRRRLAGDDGGDRPSRGIRRMGMGIGMYITGRRHGAFRRRRALLPLGCAEIRDVVGFSDGRPGP